MATAKTIELRGKPGHLSGVVREAAQSRAVVHLELPSGHSDRPFEAGLVPLPEGGLSRLVVQAPRTLPPGRYSGTVTVDDRRYPLTVEVQRREHARLTPKRVEAKTAAGATLELELSIVNNGNVDLCVPAEGSIDLFDAAAFPRLEEAAFAAAFGATESTESLETLKTEAYAGRAAVLVDEGSGPLAPSAARDLAVRVQLPDELGPRRDYAGSWHVAGRSCTLTLHVT